MISTYLVLLAAVGAFFVLRSYFSKESRARWRLNKTPLSELASAQDGTAVRVRGVVEALDGRTLEAALSQTPCVYYEAEVSEIRQGSNRSGTRYRRIAERREAIPFCIRDSSGVARVALTGEDSAVIDARFDHSVTSHAESEASERQKEFLASQAQSSVDWNGQARRLRYRERTIAVGETVTVLGIVSLENDPQGADATGFRDSSHGRRVVLNATPSAPLLISDDKKTVGAK